MTTSTNLRSVFDATVSVILLIAAGAVIWRQLPAFAAQQKSPGIKVPVTSLPLVATAVQGSPTAPVVLIEYSDFECPFCARFVADTLPEIRRTYIEPGLVQLAFRHLPLNGLHKFAQRAAEAAACAGDQGKFWPMHDALFADPRHLEDSALMARAQTLGLDRETFAECFGRSGQLNPKTDMVDKDAMDARALGIGATPAFLIGTRSVQGTVHVVTTLLGARALRDFEIAIEKVAADAGVAVPAKSGR